MSTFRPLSASRAAGCAALVLLALSSTLAGCERRAGDGTTGATTTTTPAPMTPTASMPDAASAPASAASQ